MGTKSILLLMLSCALLTACESQQERAAQKAAAEQAAQVEREKHCASFGYQRGTPEYSKCLENLYIQQQQHEAVEEANRQARLQAAARGMQQAGAALQSISPPPSPTVHCNTMPNGIGTSTTCF
ncbi:hypothetical protein CWO90_35645 [Bradyrhizobium sp. Leo121]|nr:hypothetical protein CWO90_35645 [Bradyrhizobium sp. Leo121]